MASDSVEFKRAMQKWERLHEQKRYSAALHIGETAIVYSLGAASEKPEEIQQEVAIFATEALRLAKRIQQKGGQPFILKGFNEDTFNEQVVKPESVANVIIIGHGTFSSVYDDDWNRFDWSQVSKMTTHLKQGTIRQRFCGHFRRNLSVPFGTFLASDPRRIYASAGREFMPEINDAYEHLLRPVTTEDRLTFEYIKDNFKMQTEEEDGEEEV